MSRSKQDRKRGPLDHHDIDLFGAAFNLPTRRNIELAERRAAAAAAAAAQTPPQVHIAYKGNKDIHISSSEASSSSDDDDCKEDDDSDSDYQRAQQRKLSHDSLRRRDSSVMRKNERQATRQHQQPSKPHSSKRKKLTKSKSLSTRSTPSFSPPIAAPFISPSATYPSFQRARNAAESRPMEHYQRPQAPFALATVPVAPSAQILQRAPTAIALPNHIIAPSSQTKSQPPGAVAQQIQRIQAEIDSKVVMLSQDASDNSLRNELTALQMKLNSTLNTVLDAKNQNLRQPSPEAQEERPSLQHRSIHVHGSRRDDSPERALLHHLCSGCGNVRSANFHDKHPIASGEKPVLNYCKSCQGTTTTSKAETRLERYHFCFGCGIVRSKTFQRKNSRYHTDGSALPNYCGKCTLEIQSLVGIAEASAVMDLASGVSSQGEESLGTCSVAVQASSDVTPEVASPQTQSEFSLDSAEFSDGPKKSVNSSRTSRKNYATPKTKRRAAAVKPLNFTQSSPRTPYYPDRRSGSAQRRAQRSPLTSLSGSGTHGPILADRKPTRAYRAPYVEDIPSPETQQPRSLHTVPSQRSFERVSVPQIKKKKQSRGADETAQHVSASKSGRKTVKPKANLEVHFWDSPLSGEVSSDEEDTQQRGAQDGQDDMHEMPQINHAQKPRSQFQAPSEAFNLNNSTEDPTIGEPVPQQQPDTARFWKGAFAKRDRGEAGAWANRISATTERQASPSSSSASSASSSSFAARRSTRSAHSPPESAGLSGFPPSIHEPFIPPVENIHDEDPPLRTSKGAFGSSAFMSSPFFTQEMNSGETRSSSPFSSHSSGKNKGQDSSHLRGGSGHHSGPKRSESPFGTTSSFAGFGCKFNTECFTVRDEDEPEPLFHGYGDFSHLSGGSTSSTSHGYSHHQDTYKTYCPNPNPYYMPRKSSFADMNRSGFRRRSCRSQAGDWFGDQKSRASRRGTPEWIPEPIIEEPSSPMGSPVQCAMLLEFNHSGTASPVPPLSEASTESTEPDMLEISDIE